MPLSLSLPLSFHASLTRPHGCCVFPFLAQREELRQTVYMMGIEHEQAVDIMQKRLDSEREEREKLQAKFDEAQASSKKTIGTLEGQVAELIATVANLHRQQRESSKKFIEEQGDLKAQWASQVNRLNEKR